MATQAIPPQRGLRQWVKVALRGTGYALAGFAAAFLLFLLAAWIGSSIPRNPDWQEPETGIPVMIETNGLHTGIVMPIVTDSKDWRSTFPSAGQLRDDGWMPTHIAVGWGEKEVFLNTPQWTDLNPLTAIKIVTQGGDGLLRVAHYVNPRAGENYRWIRLRPEEYARLADRIEATLPVFADGETRASYTSYENHALHFDAEGRYTLSNTCNQWVGDTLAYAGVRIGRWTPLSGGVMKWIPRD